MQKIKKLKLQIKTWRKEKLGEVCSSVSESFDFKKNNKFIFINTGDIKDGKFLHKNFFRDSRLPGQAKKAIRKHDVLYSEIRPRNKHFAFVNFDSDKFVVSTKLMVIRNNEKIDPIFLYLCLKNRNTLNVFQAIAESRSGTFPQLTFESIANFPIVLPPLQEQRLISSTISAFDNKIELNNKISLTLEQTAQAIFKEWFVNFHFPGYKKVKLVDSELGKIPEGWVVKRLPEIFDFLEGIEPGSSNYKQKISEDFLPFYRVQDIENHCTTPNIFVKKELLKGKIFKTDDILISLDGTIGRVFIGGFGGYSSGIRKVIEKKDFISKPLIHCYLKSTNFQNVLFSFSGNETTIKHAGKALDQAFFVFNTEVCKKFTQIITPIFNLTLKNIFENQELTTLRDLLLLKLMSGEIII